MNYFITGGTGFIGKNLIKELLKRKRVGTVYVLVRSGSKKKFNVLQAELGEAGKKLVAVTGDLTRNQLGVSAAQRKKLKGSIDHFFHLAAIYDLAADADSQWAANVDGTRNAVALAEDIGAKHFHHMSSIAAAGLFPGIFREDMFEEAVGLDNPYFRTKHDSEAIVRNECSVPWRVYRPGLSSGTRRPGKWTRSTDPTTFFKGIQKMRNLLPLVDAHAGYRGQPDQPRAGGLRGQGHPAHCPQAPAGRQGIPPRGFQAPAYRRNPEPVCRSRPCAENDHAH